MRVHRLLERIILPAKNIISVGRKAGAVATGPDKWLAAICRPVFLLVEGRGIPDSLEQDLGDLDGMGGWTFAAGLEGASLGVGNMVSVVGGIQVDAVPAGWEAVVCHDAELARCLGEPDSLRVTGGLGLHAGVGQLPEVSGLFAVFV